MELMSSPTLLLVKKNAVSAWRRRGRVLLNASVKVAVSLLCLTLLCLLAAHVSARARAVALTATVGPLQDALETMTGSWPETNPLGLSVVVSPCGNVHVSSLVALLRGAVYADRWNLTCAVNISVASELCAMADERVAIWWDFSADPGALGPGIDRAIQYTQHMNRAYSPDVQVLRPSQADENNRTTSKWYVSTSASLAAEHMFASVGFTAAWMQHMMDSVIVSYKTAWGAATCGGEVPAVRVRLSSFPMPGHVVLNDDFSSTFLGFAPLLLTAVFACSVGEIIRIVVEEKESGHYALLRLTTLKSWQISLSWFMTCACSESPIAVITAALLIFGGVLPTTPPPLLLLGMLCFLLSVVAFSQLVAACFSRAHIASIAGTLAFCASALPSLALGDDVLDCPWATATLGLSSPVAFSAFVSVALRSERGFFVGHDHVRRWSDSDNAVALVALSCLMIIDTAIYSVAGWYLSEARLKSMFTACFRRSFCWGGRGALAVPSCGATKPRDYRAPLRAAGTAMSMVDVLNITKVFSRNDGTEFRAVDNLCARFCKDQCTALLGHNGAGKTTLVRLLTGQLAMSSGDAVYFGHRLSEEPGRIRKMVGVCPQHDVLYPSLTVREHLELFSALKGIAPSEVDASSQRALAEVGLTSVEDSFPRELSGGMQRRLSVAIALLGDPKVVFLDEPTAGVDPGNRRALWDTISKLKRGRVMILTTHFMDEADILGDMIAIMAHGKMQAMGTPLMLKNAFGMGYTLTLEASDTEHDEDVIDLVGTHIPESEILVSATAVDGEALAFALPFETTPKFNALFKDLETHQEALGLNSFGVSTPSLQEVFVQLSRDAEQARCSKPPTTESLLKSLGRPTRTPRPRRHSIATTCRTNDGKYSQPVCASTRSQPAPNASTSRAKDFARRCGNCADVSWATGELRPCFRNTALAIIRKRYRCARAKPRAFALRTILPALAIFLACVTMPGPTPAQRSAPTVAQPQRLDCSAGGSSSWGGAVPRILFWAPPFALPVSDNSLGAANSSDTCLCDVPSDYSALMNEATATSRLNAECNSTSNRFDLLQLPGQLPIHSEPGRQASVLHPNALEHGDVCSAVTPRPRSGWQRTVAFDLLLPAGRHRKFCDSTACAAAFLFWGEDALNLACTSSSSSNGSSSNEVTSASDYKCANPELQLFYNYTNIYAIPVLLSMLGSGRLRQLNRDLPSARIDASLAYFGVESLVSARGGSNREKTADSSAHYALAMALVMSLNMLGAFQCANIVHERESGALEQLAFAGAKRAHYWSACMLWDQAVHLVSVLGALAVLHAFGVSAFTENLLVVVALIALHGYAMTMFAYATSHGFVSRTAAQNTVMLVAAFVPVLVLLLEKTSVAASTDNGTIVALFIDSLAHVSYLLPGSVLGHGLQALAEADARTKQCMASDGEGAALHAAGACNGGYNASILVAGFVAQGTLYCIALGAIHTCRSADRLMYEESCTSTNRAAARRCAGEQRNRVSRRVINITNGPIYRIAFLAFAVVDVGSMSISMLFPNDLLWVQIGMVCAIIFVLEAVVVALSKGLRSYSLNAPTLVDGTLALVILAQRIVVSTRPDLKIAQSLGLVCLLRAGRVARELGKLLTKTDANRAVSIGNVTQHSCDPDAGGVNNQEADSVQMERLRLAGVCAHRSEQRSLDANGPEASKSSRTNVPDSVRIINLHKHFATPKGTTTAIGGLYLGIREGEIFSLLGPNGAGKTTTLKALIGQLCPTLGRVDCCGFNVATQRDLLRGKLGYCTQYDSHHKAMTAREHIMFYAQIRGHTHTDAACLAESLILSLDLVACADRPTSGYSGGNKRKLSVAIALLGDARVVLLDEPTTGVDPISAQKMWQVVESWRSADPSRSVIITTHSMDEAERVAHRIGILVNGKLATVGTAQELKSNEGGLTIELSLGSYDKVLKSAIVKMVTTNVDRKVRVVGDFGQKLVLKSGHANLSTIFGFLERHRAALQITDYGVRSGSLQEIFTKFAKQQQLFQEESSSVRICLRP